MTCRRLVRYAKRKGYPMLCVHAADETKAYTDGSTQFQTLKRSPLAFPLDHSLKYDPLFQRFSGKVLRKLHTFQPDVIHITGLNDVSIMGAYLAWKLQIPLLGSWHTNLHEFASRRLKRGLRFLPASMLEGVANFAEKKILDGAVLYYKMPKINLAPNIELVEMLAERTGRESAIMGRGVDTEKFSPEHRTVDDEIVRFGFVGRLRAEKNVGLLEELEKRLLEKTDKKFEFLVVGDGNEKERLEANMKTAHFAGFLRGQPLSEAYANMDIFVFPSETEAFGNVVLEAAASGVPSILTDSGGAKFIIENNVSGFVCKNIEDFTKYALALLDDSAKLARMKEAARKAALNRSWEKVFESVYQSYKKAIEIAGKVEAREKQKK